MNTIHTFAVKFKSETNGKIYERLVGSTSKRSALVDFCRSFEGKAISARKCDKNDIGQFFQGLRGALAS